jgi:asparagine synthase (glutamine-hydrolysing)
MCGLVGFWSSLPRSIESSAAILRRMRGVLRHRGPDDEGEWIDVDSGIALGHRRLAVLDLSPAGHQPMVSHSGRYVVVFNGEIYNHNELRQRLPDSHWHGSSDTETLLAAIEHWGLDSALRATVGMFAFAVWDTRARTLSLARDRLGEKPLYYGTHGRTLMFASELKAFGEHPDFSPTIDRGAVAHYVRRGYVRGPQSIFAGVRRLPPGTFARFGGATASAALSQYWSLEAVVAERISSPFSGTPEEAVDELERLIATAVEGQRLADVPLGAFLSGGVDSSTIVAVMQARAKSPVRTFSIGFTESSYDESAHARSIATHLGTDHVELTVTPADALGVIPRLPSVYDEPFADPSQIPTVLLASLARKEVTVALSGDGGDELFCGYERYATVARLWRRLAPVPRWVRRVLGRTLPNAATRRALAVSGVDELYEFYNSQWKEHPQLVTLDDGHRPFAPPLAPWTIGDARERGMYADLGDYLPDDILVKVDRAAMAASLETRVPLLDHRIVEFAWSLPIEMKAHGDIAKWPLKQVLYKHVPRALVERPKQGFGVPLESWLRGPLREWAEDLLSPSRLASHGLLDEQAVLSEWRLHLSGKRDRHYGLWTVLMFQAWYAAHF